MLHFFSLALSILFVLFMCVIAFISLHRAVDAFRVKRDECWIVEILRDPNEWKMGAEKVPFSWWSTYQMLNKYVLLSIWLCTREQINNNKKIECWIGRETKEQRALVHMFDLRKCTIFAFRLENSHIRNDFFSFMEPIKTAF